MMGAEGAILKCAPDVEMVPLAEGGSMLVDLKSGHCFQLNRVGADIWGFFQGGGSPSTIVDDLLGRYEIDRAKLEEDVGRLVRDLTGHGLLVSDLSQPR